MARGIWLVLLVLSFSVWAQTKGSCGDFWESRESLPVFIDGQRDAHFLATVVHGLDSFWQSIFDSEISMDALGATRNVRARMSLVGGKAWTLKALKVVLYDEDIVTPCGRWAAGSLPFHCGVNGTVYISHDSLLRAQSGNFPATLIWTAILAHEMGHHLQNHLKITRPYTTLDEATARELELRLELQADCLAGVWFGRNSDVLEPGELVHVAEYFGHLGDSIHGSSEQRRRWFEAGTRGDVKACDTFRVVIHAL